MEPIAGSVGFEPKRDCVKTNFSFRKLPLLELFGEELERIFKYKAQFLKLNSSFHTLSKGGGSNPKKIVSDSENTAKTEITRLNRCQRKLTFLSVPSRITLQKEQASVTFEPDS